MTHTHPLDCCHQDNYPFAHVNQCGATCNPSCGHIPPVRPHVVKPSGTVAENKFRILNGMPYLIDMPLLKWGPAIKVSEQIDTKVTQRPDQSCVRLDATFDCTNSFARNAALKSYLQQIIERQYDDLQGILPIIDEWTHFKLTYHVTNAAGATIIQNNAVVSCKEGTLHITEMPDVFTNSFKSIFMIDLPDFTTYGAGTYTLVLEKLEVYVSGFEPKEHMEDLALNPYYAFMDNYTNIAMDHNACANVDPDYSCIPVATININKSFGYNSAVTTRLKMAFTAYMSDLIIVGNTFDIWSSLTQPTDAIVNTMKTDLDTLKATVITMQNAIAAQAVKITNLETLAATQATAITTLTTTLASTTEALTSLTARVTALDGGVTETPGGSTSGGTTSGGTDTTGGTTSGGTGTDGGTTSGGTSDSTSGAGSSTGDSTTTPPADTTGDTVDAGSTPQPPADTDPDTTPSGESQTGEDNT